MNEGTLLDRALMLVALLGQAVPSFWLGLLLIIWLGLDLGWLPINGLDDWTGYVLPAITLAFSAIPAMMRLTRSGMVDALRADYIRTARAKGLAGSASWASTRCATPRCRWWRSPRCSWASCWAARSWWRRCSTCPAWATSPGRASARTTSPWCRPSC